MLNAGNRSKYIHPSDSVPGRRLHDTMRTQTSAHHRQQHIIHQHHKLWWVSRIC